MLTTQKPLGGVVALANLEKDVVPYESIQMEIANLVDLLSIRIKDRTVEQVADSLLETMFDLRLSLAGWLLDKEDHLQLFTDKLESYISVNMTMAPYSLLAETVSEAMLAHHTIVRPLMSGASSLLPDLGEEIKNIPLTYQTYKVLALHPALQIKFLKDWVDASLQYEVALLIADLVLTGQLKMSQPRIRKELVAFIKDAITRFGAYSIITGSWIPDDEDDSFLTNRMKIHASMIQVENGISEKTSLEELRALLLD